MRTALGTIAALASKHLQSVPREFLDNDTGDNTDEPPADRLVRGMLLNIAETDEPSDDDQPA
jgi:hypothetical protein